LVSSFTLFSLRDELAWLSAGATKKKGESDTVREKVSTSAFFVSPPKKAPPAVFEVSHQHYLKRSGAIYDKVLLCEMTFYFFAVLLMYSLRDVSHVRLSSFHLQRVNATCRKANRPEEIISWL